MQVNSVHSSKGIKLRCHVLARLHSTLGPIMIWYKMIQNSLRRMAGDDIILTTDTCNHDSYWHMADSGFAVRWRCFMIKPKYLVKFVDHLNSVCKLLSFFDLLHKQT